jgi:hypothetical protein
VAKKKPRMARDKGGGGGPLPGILRGPKGPLPGENTGGSKMSAARKEQGIQIQRARGKITFFIDLSFIVFPLETGAPDAQGLKA